MSHIVAPQGSPLAFAVVSCERLEVSLGFYRDVIGFDAGPVMDWPQDSLARLWGLPGDASARACLLGTPGCEAGRILLVEFHSAARRMIHPSPSSLAFGLSNLNFYTADIHAASRRLRDLGYQSWSEPTQHSLEPSVGNPIEVVFDGPDGVAINLVELTSTDLAQRIGQMRAYVERHGYNRCGFTPVVTSAEVVRSIAKTRRFLERVAGMGVLFDDEMSADRVNRFLRLPAGARTRITFMQGGHMFGKVALSEPLNYAESCVDLEPVARAPNIGYLARGFEVRDLERAWQACREIGAPVVVEPAELVVPGLGSRRQFMARSPGSGALQWVLAAPGSAGR